MASSPSYGDAPPLQSYRRSFTAPHKALSYHDRALLDTSDSAAEILYSHPSARIISFSPPKESVVSKNDATLPDTDYPIDTVETLPWRSRTETLAATGLMLIEKVRGSTNFLKAGATGDFMHAIMRNSQCWCVDGESKFVLRVRKLQYYRIELPAVTDADKAKVEEFKGVLPKILRYERTPCPFKRAFQVELPDDAITPRRKGAWKRREGSLASTPETESPPLRRTKNTRTWSMHSPSPLATQSEKSSRRVSDLSFLSMSKRLPYQRDSPFDWHGPSASSNASSDDLASQDAGDASSDADSYLEKKSQNIIKPSTLEQQSFHPPDLNSVKDSGDGLDTYTLEVVQANQPQLDDHMQESMPETEEHKTDSDITAALVQQIDEAIDAQSAKEPISETDSSSLTLEESMTNSIEDASVLETNVPQSEITPDAQVWGNVTESDPKHIPATDEISLQIPPTQGLSRQSSAEQIDALSNIINQIAGSNASSREDLLAAQPVEPEVVAEVDVPMPISMEQEFTREMPVSGLESDLPQVTGNTTDVESSPLNEVPIVSEGDLSRASTINSFYTTNSDGEHMVHQHEFTDTDKTPQLQQYGFSDIKKNAHKRELSEVTVTASTIDEEPSSDLLNRYTTSEEISPDKPCTPGLLRSSASDSSWPDVVTPSSALPPDGLRRRLKAQRSLSPLPSSENIVSTPVHEEKSFLNPDLVKKAVSFAVFKPVEVVLLIVHILTRIAGGATVSDLISGELFKRPEQPLRMRAVSFPDRIAIPQHDDEEDDFGIPIRGQSKNKSAGTPSADDTDADSLFDLD